MWHLIDDEADRDYLSGHPEASEPAVAELARYLTPLPGIERVTSGAPADEHPSGQSYVLLDFASANHDPTVWPDADRSTSTAYGSRTWPSGSAGTPAWG